MDGKNVALFHRDGSQETTTYVDFLDRVHRRKFDATTEIRDPVLSTGDRIPITQLLLFQKSREGFWWPWSRRHAWADPPDQSLCECFRPPTQKLNDRAHRGIDYAHGRYGDVYTANCFDCDRSWLMYHVEFESHTGASKWFRALITPETAARMVPDGAIAYFWNSPWFFFGGDYYRGWSVGYYHACPDLTGKPLTK